MSDDEICNLPWFNQDWLPASTAAEEARRHAEHNQRTITTENAHLIHRVRIFTIGQALWFCRIERRLKVPSLERTRHRRHLYDEAEVTVKDYSYAWNLLRDGWDDYFTHMPRDLRRRIRSIKERPATCHDWADMPTPGDDVVREAQEPRHGKQRLPPSNYVPWHLIKVDGIDKSILQLSVADLRRSRLSTAAWPSSRHQRLELDPDFKSNSFWKDMWRFCHAKWRSVDHINTYFQVLHGKIPICITKVLSTQRRAPVLISDLVTELNIDRADYDSEVIIPEQCPFCSVLRRQTQLVTTSTQVVGPQPRMETDRPDHFFFKCPWAEQVWSRSLDILELLDSDAARHVRDDLSDTAMLFCWPTQRRALGSSRFTRRVAIWHAATLHYLYQCHEHMRLLTATTAGDSVVRRRTTAERMLLKAVNSIKVDIIYRVEEQQVRHAYKAGRTTGAATLRDNDDFRRIWIDGNFLATPTS